MGGRHKQKREDMASICHHTNTIREYVDTHPVLHDDITKSILVICSKRISNFILSLPCLKQWVFPSSSSSCTHPLLGVYSAAGTIVLWGDTSIVGLVLPPFCSCLVGWVRVRDAYCCGNWAAGGHEQMMQKRKIGERTHLSLWRARTESKFRM